MDNGAVFNVIVLIGSLIGTVVVAFTMIMQLLEQYLGISTDEPSTQVTGDQFTTASSIESKMAGDAKAKKASSSKYVDFDEDAAGAADRHGGDGVDDGSMMGARPFHGNVVIQSSECAIEMQNVSKSQPVSSMPSDGSVPASHQSQSASDRDSQVMSMLADIQRKMHEQSTQLAFLTSQMARSEAQVASLAADHAALKADLAHTVQLQDQKHQHSAQSVFELEQWIRESRAAAAPEAIAASEDAAF